MKGQEITREFLNPNESDFKELDKLISECDHTNHFLAIDGLSTIYDLYCIRDHGTDGINWIALIKDESMNEEDE